MKKIISSLIASGMLVASVAPANASVLSDDTLNSLSLCSSVLTEDVVINGTLITSGTTAVTVNITNNTGFDNSRTVLNLGEAFDVIEGEDNNPIIANGIVFDDSLSCAVENDNILAVVSASADIKDDDGAMFTFYVNVDEENNDNSISILDMPEITEETAPVNNRSGWYLLGNVNGDSVVDGRDATKVLTVVMNDTTYPDHRLPIGYVQSNISTLFPDIPYSVIADTFITTTYDQYGDPIINENYVSQEDAYDILSYYAYASAMGGYVGRVGTYKYIY